MVRYHTLLSLRELGRRAVFLDAQLEHLDELITPLVTARAPGLLSLYEVGPDTAAMLLIAAGDHPAAAASVPCEQVDDRSELLGEEGRWNPGEGGPVALEPACAASRPAAR
jgi:hypothetical protein